MPLNAQLPLLTQTPDLSPALNQALFIQDRQREIERQKKEAPLRQQLLEAQVKGAGAQNQLTEAQLQELKDSHDMKSIVYGALSVKPLLENGNTDGALAALMARREQIRARGGNTADTDEVISQLQSGDAKGALANLNSAISLGTQMGILKQGPQQPDNVQSLIAAGYKPNTPEFRDALFKLEGRDTSMTPYQSAQIAIDQEKNRIERDKLNQGPDGPQTFKQATQLRNEFIDQSKEYRLQNEAIGRIAASAKDPSAAGDLSLIFNYMKVLDPGSTVREGEFATAQNAGGVPDRAIAAYNKVLSGERLSTTQRADFVDRANKIYRQAQGQHKKRESEYTRLAQQNRIDPKNVIVDLSSYQPESDQAAPPDAQPTIQEGQTATNPQTGEKLIFRGGQWQKP